MKVANLTEESALNKEKDSSIGYQSIGDLK